MKPVLTRYREQDGGLVPHPDGEFVRHDEALRHFQWAAFDRMLNWINEREERSFPRKLLYHTLVELRPEPVRPTQEDLIEALGRARRRAMRRARCAARCAHGRTHRMKTIR